MVRARIIGHVNYMNQSKRVKNDFSVGLFSSAILDASFTRWYALVCVFALVAAVSVSPRLPRTACMQIMAPAWREDSCLRVAEVVEAVTHRIRPSMLYSNLA